MIEPSSAEPEDLISNSLYLLQLVQMDLNIPRHGTIPARVSAILKNVTALANYFPLGGAAPEIDPALFEAEYLSLGWSKEVPADVGLYGITSKDLNYYPSYIAVTQDGQNLFVHDFALPKKRRVDLYWAEQSPLAKKLA